MRGLDLTVVRYSMRISFGFREVGNNGCRTGSLGAGRTLGGPWSEENEVEATGYSEEGSVESAFEGTGMHTCTIHL